MSAVILSTHNANWDVPVLISANALMVLMFAGGIGFVIGHGWSRVVLWPISVIFLLAFPVGTVLGAYNLWVLYNTRGQATPRRSLLLGFAIWAVFLVLFFALLPSESQHTPFERQLLAAIEAQGGKGEFQQWFSALPRDTSKAAAAVMLLGQRGLARLGADDQFNRVGLLVDRLGRSSPSDCAAFARGSATAQQQLALIQGLDSTGLRQWFELTARAILAELRNSPLPNIASDSDIKDYVTFLYDPLPQADRRRLDVALDSLSTTSDGDACWFLLLWYRRALENHASRARWLRVVTTIASRSGQ